MRPFAFELGQRVRVTTHPARPVGTVTARWTAKETADVHSENVYAVSVFVTKQRESSLEPVSETEAPPPESSATEEPTTPSPRRRGSS